MTSYVLSRLVYKSPTYVRLENNYLVHVVKNHTQFRARSNPPSLLG